MILYKDLDELKTLVYAELDKVEHTHIQSLANRVLRATIESMRDNYLEAQEEQSGFTGTRAENLIIEVLRW